MVAAAAAGALASWSTPAAAQSPRPSGVPRIDTNRVVTLAPVRVTVTRDIGRSTLDLPYAISIVQPDSTRPGQTRTRLDETMFLLPGITLANRNNPAQDTRLSIRGFGARSAFGVRSIRVLRDGMPLTLPDGQTPMDYLDLESVGRVEAIRGAASALYGNAGGGVVDLRSTAPPEAPFAVQSRSWVGGSDPFHGEGTFRRYAGIFGGSLGPAYYQGNVGRSTAENQRLYSNQRLTNGYLRVGTTAAGTDLVVQALGFRMPLAENPGALTQAQFDQNPQAADSLSVVRRARKEVDQLQLGLSATRPLGLDAQRGELFGQVYGGSRSLYNPLTFAVVDVERKQYGAAARATLPFSLGGVSQRLSIGIDAQRQDDNRRNWAACNGITRVSANCPTLLVEKGVLQLDQEEIVSSVGPYLRDELTFGRLTLNGGVRADAVRFEVRDHFLSDGRDDSGARTMRAVSPLFAAIVHATRSLSVYANLASAFETPTTTELANQPNGSAGLNRDLKPQYSTTLETGVKGVIGTRVRYDVSLFNTNVRDELIPAEIPGSNGRTYYRNAGRTNRRGVELSAGTDAGPLELGSAYTYSHFLFRDFASGTAQYAGQRIPGIPEQQLQTSATLRIQHGYGTIESQTKSAVYVNDANTAKAAGFTIVNARIGGVAAFGWPWLSPVFGVQNAFDKRYVGSVAVNAAGTPATGKFYEPAPGRTWYFGLTVAGGR